MVLWTRHAKKGRLVGETDFIRGTLPGKRRKGIRPKTSWNGNITLWTGLKLDQLMGQVEERTEWRQIVHSATSRRIEDG